MANANKSLYNIKYTVGVSGLMKISAVIHSRAPQNKLQAPLFPPVTPGSGERPVPTYTDQITNEIMLVACECQR